jgi:hypothetical protein
LARRGNKEYEARIGMCVLHEAVVVARQMEENCLICPGRGCRTHCKYFDEDGKEQGLQE